MSKSTSDLAQFIEHTLLKPDATSHELKQLCQEAKDNHFKGVCVNPCNIELVVDFLQDTDIIPVSVIGFPLGASTTQSKAFEAQNAVANGAKEIDMVINIGALKNQNYELVLTDIKGVVSASYPEVVKVIIETALLTDEEKIKACELAKEAKAHFVKTSTGFASGGAKVEDIELMRRVVGPKMGVKASGGIKTADIAKDMIKAGANRLGCSSSVAIVNSQGKA